LERLAQGEAVEFTGSAINHEQAPRRVEGKATPTDALHGKLKVRVFVSPKIELIFNTTYSFAPPVPGALRPPDRCSIELWIRSSSA
jgi:hypothetical protein